MARRLRVQFPGAIYHVLNRGDRRDVVFVDDADRSRFIETLAETCAKTSWQIHAFVLMPNHFHLVIETPEPNLVAGMKWLLGTYTSRFNRRHQQTGHLFGGRYKSLLVGGQGGYLRTVVDYVHLNPDRSNLVDETQPLRDFQWSSLPLFLGSAARRPVWLRADRVLGECGISKDSAVGWREYERQLEARRGQDLDFDGIRHGWCFGDESFRNSLLESSEKAFGTHHNGPEVRESAVEKAARIVRAELERNGWSESELRSRPKTDPKKLAAAEKLRRETTMTLAWIADRLAMGSQGYLAHILYWRRRGGRATKSSRPLELPKRAVRRSRPTLQGTGDAARPRTTWTEPVLPFDASFD